MIRDRRPDLTPRWAHEGFSVGPRGLELDGHSLADLASTHGTPLYVYSLARVRHQLGRLRGALETVQAPSRIYYAVKANRHPEILASLRAEGDIGIDACSPREVALALEAGFHPSEVSVTASMLSDRDLDTFAAQGVHLNLDSHSALRRYGARVRQGTTVGLRLDPHTATFEDAPTWLPYGDGKFGLAVDQIEAALTSAQAAGLEVDTLHVHCGWNLPARALPWVERTFALVAAVARQIPSVRALNVGGGLSPGFGPAESPLSLSDWAAALRAQLAPLGRQIVCEPGTFLLADAGVLLVEVNTVEMKAGTTWIGVDAGHNVYNYPAMYGGHVDIAHVARPHATPARCYNVAGNINEPHDVFARDRELPPVEEGDLLAFLRTGAYGASMASDHCLRGQPREILLQMLPHSL